MAGHEKKQTSHTRPGHQADTGMHVKFHLKKHTMLNGRSLFNLIFALINSK